jgi:hypothetical protein
MSEIKLNQISVDGKLFCRECEREINGWRRVESKPYRERVLITIQSGIGKPYVITGFYHSGKWFDGQGDTLDHDDKVLAWMPLPEAFEG